MRRIPRTPILAAAVLVFLAAGSQIAHRAGLRLNLTASAPLGFYHLESPTPAKIVRGALVEFCPPSWVTPAAFPFYMSGDCPSGGMAMLKTIVGIPGDRVSAGDGGIEIDGVMLAGSETKLRSTSYPEVPLPAVRGEIVLGPGEYWVYGGGAHLADAARSFDSRYFGAITIAQVHSVIRR